MNETVNRFLLRGDEFMLEMHSKPPGSTYSACEPFTKNGERIQKFMQTSDTNYIYSNDLDKACFKHDMAYGRYKDLKQLNSIEALISQALVDLEISHGKFKTIVYEKEKYDRMKESIRNIKSTDKEDEFLDFDIFLDIFGYFFICF